MAWTATLLAKSVPKLKDAVFIEGLPGIGNVGKVAIDFIIEHTKAEKLYELFSYSLPHSVFINESNLIEMPSITIYYKKGKKKDLLLLAGDAQPIDEVSSYEFCEKTLDVAGSFGCREVVTLGGIGLPSIPKKPRVYCTGNSKDVVESYVKGSQMETKLYGTVGPIVGVSGLLLGIAKRRNVPAVSLLAETYGHPMYLGVKGAREIVKVLNKRLELGLNTAELDREIDQMESEMGRRPKAGEQLPRGKGAPSGGETSYIG